MRTNKLFSFLVVLFMLLGLLPQQPVQVQAVNDELTILYDGQYLKNAENPDARIHFAETNGIGNYQISLDAIKAGNKLIIPDGTYAILFENFEVSGFTIDYLGLDDNINWYGNNDVIDITATNRELNLNFTQTTVFDQVKNVWIDIKNISKTTSGEGTLTLTAKEETFNSIASYTTFNFSDYDVGVTVMSSCNTYNFKVDTTENVDVYFVVTGSNGFFVLPNNSTINRFETGTYITMFILDKGSKVPYDIGFMYDSTYGEMPVDLIYTLKYKDGTTQDFKINDFDFDNTSNEDTIYYYKDLDSLDKTVDYAVIKSSSIEKDNIITLTNNYANIVDDKAVIMPELVLCPKTDYTMRKVKFVRETPFKDDNAYTYISDDSWNFLYGIRLKDYKSTGYFEVELPISTKGNTTFYIKEDNSYFQTHSMITETGLNNFTVSNTDSNPVLKFTHPESTFKTNIWLYFNFNNINVSDNIDQLRNITFNIKGLDNSYNESFTFGSIYDSNTYYEYGFDIPFGRYEITETNTTLNDGSEPLIDASYYCEQGLNDEWGLVNSSFSFDRNPYVLTSQEVNKWLIDTTNCSWYEIKFNHFYKTTNDITVPILSYNAPMTKDLTIELVDAVTGDIYDWHGQEDSKIGSGDYVYMAEFKSVPQGKYYFQIWGAEVEGFTHNIKFGSLPLIWEQAENGSIVYLPKGSRGTPTSTPIKSNKFDLYDNIDNTIAVIDYTEAKANLKYNISSRGATLPDSAKFTVKKDGTVFADVTYAQLKNNEDLLNFANTDPANYEFSYSAVEIEGYDVKLLNEDALKSIILKANDDKTNTDVIFEYTQQKGSISAVIESKNEPIPDDAIIKLSDGQQFKFGDYKDSDTHATIEIENLPVGEYSLSIAGAEQVGFKLVATGTQKGTVTKDNTTNLTYTIDYQPIPKGTLSVGVNSIGGDIPDEAIINVKDKDGNVITEKKYSDFKDTNNFDIADLPENDYIVEISNAENPNAPKVSGTLKGTLTKDSGLSLMLTVDYSKKLPATPSITEDTGGITIKVTSKGIQTHDNALIKLYDPDDLINPIKVWKYKDGKSKDGMTAQFTINPILAKTGYVVTIEDVDIQGYNVKSTGKITFDVTKDTIYIAKIINDYSKINNKGTGVVRNSVFMLALTAVIGLGVIIYLDKKKLN